MTCPPSSSSYADVLEVRFCTVFSALLIGARTSSQLAGSHLLPFLATLSMYSLPDVTSRSEAMFNLSLSSECCLPLQGFFGGRGQQDLMQHLVNTVACCMLRSMAWACCSPLKCCTEGNPLVGLCFPSCWFVHELCPFLCWFVRTFEWRPLLCSSTL